MQVHHDINHLTIRNPVVTTGSFDGVHVGHQTIIRRLNDLAREIDGESVLISFYPHPRKVLYPDTAGRELQMIYSQPEKIRQLEKTGLDHLIIIEFTLKFSRISSVDFIRSILVEKLHASCVVIGFNHHFGHNREGDYEYLREIGKFYHFTVEEIPEQDIHNESVSSTKIRKALRQGNIQRANAYLDHPYFMMGKAEPQQKLSDNPSSEWFILQISDESKLIPPAGSYALIINPGSDRTKGLGVISRWNGQPLLRFTCLEASEKVMMDEEVIVELHKKIRQSGDQETLSEDQISADRMVVKELIY